MIPEWMGMQAYDLSSLLALVPGLILKNDDIEIAGIGKPVYILNGLNPQMGELESLNPRDIEKVNHCPDAFRQIWTDCCWNYLY